MKRFWKNVEKEDNARLATQTPPDGLTEICNLPYLDDGDRYHLLDVYYPQGTVAPLPVIVDIHGGGWMYADKELNKNYCLTLAKRGFTVFNVSYRLAPNVTVGEQIQDVMAALTWIGSHLADYPCDPNAVLLTGDSAGGQLAAHAAALCASEKLRRIFDVPTCALPIDCLALTSPAAYMRTPGGAMVVYTRRLWGKDWRKRETANYMDLDNLTAEVGFPPTIIITSSGDFVQGQCRRAARDLESAGARTELLDYGEREGQKLPHVFSVLHPESAAGVEAIDAVIAFFRNAIAAKEAQIPPASA